MFEILFKIWFMIAVLPFLVFLEGNKMLKQTLKEKKIYSHWDIWHSYIVVLIILAVILLLMGYR
ncbi:MAG TPA: hypothetical protein VK675_04395 [Candidatus Paceibacterota bacterium]|nr:hypothetical protein [Candidatus Paceibacterota bacterium]